MSKKKKKQTGGKGKHTSISAHQQEKTKLKPPLAEHNVHMLDFERDLLPEHLWLAGLADVYTLAEAHKPFYEFMDVLDEYWVEGSPAIGFISDFGWFPNEKREEFINNNRDLIEAVFIEPIGRILAFYPGNPAAWLLQQRMLSKNGSLDPEVEISRLRRLVIELLSAKDEHTGHIRSLPLGRILKHGKIAFSPEISTPQLMFKYPQGCTEDEKKQVQSFARTTVNMHYEQESRYSEKLWPKNFWRHNYDLTLCKPGDVPLQGAEPLTEDQAPRVVETLESNAMSVRKYLEDITTKVRVDLYDPRSVAENPCEPAV